MRFDNFFWRRKIFFAVEKSKVANRLKRVFPKFEADRSEVRGVNGRSKFDVRGVNATSKCISRKYPPRPPKYFYRQICLPEGFCWFLKTKVLSYYREINLHLYFFLKRSGVIQTVHHFSKISASFLKSWGVVSFQFQLIVLSFSLFAKFLE